MEEPSDPDFYLVQSPHNTSQLVLSLSFPYQAATPQFYWRGLISDVTPTITTMQMDPQSHAMWNTAAANINGGRPTTTPSPQQSSFAEYWRQINSEDNSSTHRTRRGDPSSASGLRNGQDNNGGPVGPHPSLEPSSNNNSYSPSELTMPASIPLQGATRYLVPQLELNTSGVHNGHAVPIFLSPHHMSFPPSQDLLVTNGNGSAAWSDEPSPRSLVLARSQPPVGASPQSGSGMPTTLWHNMPRSVAQPPSRWNPSFSSSTWPPAQMASSASIPHGHAPAQPPRQPPMNTLPPPSAPLPTSEGSTVVRTDAGYRLPSSSMPPPDSTGPSRSTNLTVERNRPALVVRRRTSLSAQASGVALAKRKPLPKIYGCDGCGKKFDRPSTLKVHEAIHTGAKDHLCEYCIRAFTVQSNMKRHMRVCKHKPLSPPMSLCYFVCTTPSSIPQPLPTNMALPFLGAYQASMDHLDRSSSVTLDGNSGAGPSSSNIRPTISTASQHPPMVQTASSGNVPMVPFEHPHPLAHNGPAPTVKGYKAPMIIAAMFSVQQGVPASIAKLTLVHLECDIPLPPVSPHPLYSGLYPVTPGKPAEYTIPYPPDLERSMTYTQSSLASSSTASIPATIHSFDSSTVVNSTSDDKSFISNMSDDTLLMERERQAIREEREELERQYDQRMFETCLLTEGVLPLANIRYEERNSYYPRSRYPYHPAEYDEVALLPGPGVVDLPEEAIGFQPRE